MKIRGSIAWFVGLVSLTTLLVLLSGNRKSEIVPTPSPQQSTSSVLALQPGGFKPANGTPQTNDGAVTVSAAESHDKVSLQRGILSTYNDVPIDFYGRLEDQFSNTVPNAKVTFSIQVYNGAESTVRRGQVLTDATGLFTISGFRGESLGIVPVKEGYVLATAVTFFKYSHLEDHPYEPDQRNPTVLKMWKLMGAQPLDGINRTFKLPYTDKPIFLDMVKGTIVQNGGDLELIVTREPGIITQKMQDHRDWSIRLLPVDGGIIESDYHAAQVAFEAPSQGYQSSYLVQMSRLDERWFDNIYKTFFMMSRNGHVYSRFSFGFQINGGPNDMMWLQFKGVANTNGSPNWEGTAPQ